MKKQVKTLILICFVMLVSVTIVYGQQPVTIKFSAPMAAGSSSPPCTADGCSLGLYTFRVDGVDYYEKELEFQWDAGSQHSVKALWAGYKIRPPRAPSLYYLFQGWTDGVDSRERTITVVANTSITYSLDASNYFVEANQTVSQASITYPANSTRFIPADIPLNQAHQELYEKIFCLSGIDVVYQAYPKPDQLFNNWRKEESPWGPIMGYLNLTRDNPTTMSYTGVGSSAWPVFVDKKIYENNFDTPSDTGLWYLNPSKWRINNPGTSGQLELVEANPNGDEYVILTSYSWEIFSIDLEARATDPARPNYFIIFGANDLPNTTSSSYYLQFASYGAINLYKTVDGQASLIASKPLDYSTDLQTHQIHIERLYNKEGGIVVSADGTPLFDLTDSEFETGYIALGSWKSTAIFDNIHITGSVYKYGTVDLVLPAEHDLGFPPLIYDLEADYGEIVEIPVTVSTFENLKTANLTLNYNSSHLEFKSVSLGDSVANSAEIGVNPNPGFFTSNDPYYDRNVLVEISGDGGPLIMGKNNAVVKYQFRVMNRGSVLFLFDKNCDHTWVKTVDDEIFCDEQINFNAGKISIVDDGTHFDVDGKIAYFANNNLVSVSNIKVSGPIVTSAVLGSESRSGPGALQPGYYSARGLPAGDYAFQISKYGDIRTAITGSDVIQTLQSLAFLTQLNAGQQVVADVNEDGRISGADAVALLRYLAFFPNSTGQTGNWRFTPEVSSLHVAQHETQDFTAYLLGDVNGSWGIQPATAGKRSPAFITMQLDNNALNPMIVLRTGDKSNLIQSIQTKLNWPDDAPSHCEFVPAAHITQFATYQQNQNDISMALANIEGIRAGDEIGYFVFKDLSVNYNLDAVVSLLVVNDKLQKNANVGDSELGPGLPTAFQLHPNFPNPFNPETTLRYDVPQDTAADMKLLIYSLQGQVVRSFEDLNTVPGTHQVRWDGRDKFAQSVGSGTYIALFQAGGFNQSIKMTLVK